MKPPMTICFLMWVSISSVHAQYNATNLSLEPASSQTKFNFQSLALYPVRANKIFLAYYKDVGMYVTLKGALEKRKVRFLNSKMAVPAVQ